MSTTLVITAAQEGLRRSVVRFAEVTAVPPEIREALVEVLSETLPAGMDSEQIGWTLHALSGALMALVRVAVETNGITAADELLSPRLLGAIASAAEGFVSAAELPDWEA